MTRPGLNIYQRGLGLDIEQNNLRADHKSRQQTEKEEENQWKVSANTTVRGAQCSEGTSAIGSMSKACASTIHLK